VTPKNSPVSKEDVEAVLECASSMDSPLGAPCSVVDEMHRAEILEALRIHRGKKEAAAKALGISRPTLDRRMRKLGLLPP
jgi:transcriptional regulator of acetoin/glycerol metabolism